VYRLLVASFDALERLITAVQNGVSGAWRAVRDGPLQNVLFWLILIVTGLLIIVRAVLEELDELLAGVEKALISVALLAMTAFSFLDYLRREVPGVDLSIQGGAKMAVVLMVWVGFLGASLATRQKKHLSVDASDRLLSPAAARLVKRFSALAAAAFCWVFTSHATALMDESLIGGEGLEALPLWDWLVAPINLLGSTLLAPEGLPIWVGIAAAAILLALVPVLRRWRAAEANGHTISVWRRSPVQVVGALALVVGGLALLGHRWAPADEDGVPFAWTDLQTSAQDIEAQSEELKELDATLDDLFADTGAPSGEPAVAGPSAAELRAQSSGGQAFPLWLAQAVIPLSFLLMALRFLALGLGKGFVPDPDSPPPPLQWEQTTGRGKRDLIFAGLFPGVLIGLVLAASGSIGWAIFVGALLLILVGAPLFLGIGVAALAAVTLIQDFSGLIIARDMFDAVKKEELLAIPFFVLAGNIMTQGSIAERLVGVARAAMGRTPGGLGLASVFACVIFAAISGSSPVTVIAVGGIMFPMLLKERYPQGYSSGVLTSAGSLGIIIPPSVPMIIYAIMVSNPKDPLSPNDLFIAGVLPGLLIASALALYTLYQTRPTRPGLKISIPKLEDGYFRNLGRELLRSIPALMLPVLILGGIYGVLGPVRFTVTEAAAVAVVYALFVELIVHRELKFKQLPKVLADSGVMMGSLFLIIVLAIAFNKFISEQYIPQNAAAWLQAHVSSRWQFLILVNLFLLGLGMFMEIISAILIVAPLLAPIAISYGIDPIHFGIIFIVNLELGYLTPPMGINLFVASTVFKRPVVEIIRGVVPFFFIMLVCLAIIALVPWLSLALL
jgi:C4-dicarboxylate transporter, DctM subunit